MIGVVGTIVASAAAKKILPILVEAGTGLLVDVVKKESPAAGAVVEKIAASLGIAPTPEAIVESYGKDPENTIAAAQAVERDSPEMWAYLAQAQAAQAEMLKRDDQSEHFLSWAWRPLMSWLLMLLWLWNAMLLPVINAATGAEIYLVPWEQLLAFSGIWLTVYGGGHTLKSVMGK